MGTDTFFLLQKVSVPIFQEVNMDTNQNDRDSILADVVEELCDPESYAGVTHPSPHDMPMPSVETLEEIVELLRAVIFPGYFGVSEIKPSNMRFHIGAMLDRVSRLLAEQIKVGTCFACPGRPVSGLPRMRNQIPRGHNQISHGPSGNPETPRTMSRRLTWPIRLPKRTARRYIAIQAFAP